MTKYIENKQPANQKSAANFSDSKTAYFLKNKDLSALTCIRQMEQDNIEISYTCNDQMK